MDLMFRAKYQFDSSVNVAVIKKVVLGFTLYAYKKISEKENVKLEMETWRQQLW